jgi:nucleoside permease NupC
MIATYALCGFSNVSMIGGQIGVLNEMCPERKHDYSAVYFTKKYSIAM